MDIAILGTGRIGEVLGRRLGALGHVIRYGSRDPGGEKARRVAQAADAQALDFASAAESAELVILAAPWTSACQLAASLGDLRSKILIDCTNPLNEQFNGLALGFDISAAERIQQAAPTARIVKAFNTASAATIEDPDYDGQRATMFYCGDDVEARRVVGDLLNELGFEPVDGGPLSNARHLEPMAMFYIYLAMNGWGSHCALKILKRDPLRAK